MYNLVWLPLGLLLVWCQNVTAHGGVSIKEDFCVIQIGFFRAHFAVYQPQQTADQEFCEDIPETTDTIFVLNYLHNSLKHAPVDFRIIKDVNNLGRFAKWQDIARLEDIEEDTVFYQTPRIRPEAMLKVAYKFEEPGSYIGIVTAKYLENGKTYNAVFPFEVGGKTNFGIIQLFILLGILIEIVYLYSNGILTRWYRKLRIHLQQEIKERLPRVR